ncbi:hypothetical protein LCGC14_0601070, partial [marine sediment metagenome]
MLSELKHAIKKELDYQDSLPFDERLPNHLVTANIISRFKPHLRGEFPREAVELLKELAALGSKERLLDITSKAIELSSRANAFESLWNGVTEVTGDMVKPRGDLVEGNDNLCDTCGGTKVFHMCFGDWVPGRYEFCEICPEGIEHVKEEPCPVCQCGTCGGSREKQITTYTCSICTLPVATCASCPDR